MIDFSVEPEFQAKLDWMLDFVKRECEPLDILFPHHGDPYDTRNETSRAIIRPLQEQVKQQGLWACHLDPHLGGEGYGQLKLALMNEILGRSYWAPTVFGTAAPDTGNAEILAMFGTEEQKAKYLQPLLDGDIVSTFSMTEPHAGADPKEFVCKAYRDGDEWVIEGDKWFSSNARYAAFLIVMAVTDSEAEPHRRMSMFVVPAETPGINILRNVGTIGDDPEADTGTHGYIRYEKVRVPLDAMLGGPGDGFKVAQARLGGGRVHHAMRTVGRCQRALEMMLERAVSRRTQGRPLSDHQFVQGMIADSAIELEMFRLLVLKTAWIIDHEPHGAARTHIAMCKVQMATIYHDIVRRAIHIHGSYGVSNETPLASMWQGLLSLGLADGPTEVHKVQVAKALLRKAKPSEGIFPSEHLPARREAALARHAGIWNARQPVPAE
ncbi:acyl-CoA dehydrogenase family protein [Sphingobium sp. Sx8-8]|uniref:acyl-CoA dehydrogenase family protein n=1 Tax=Sphingobium sp. Sx8-8 TaxID=2933617 RepID=UPI001F5954D5|nr:acyl-CoA dehydrogenase family protein [Sphingobium sp. Sx8-8]